MSTAREATRIKSHKKNQPLQPRIGDGFPKHVPLSGQTPAVVVRDGVTLLQLNVEGLTKAKINVLTRLAQAHAVTAILLQETHYQRQIPPQDPGINPRSLHRKRSAWHCNLCETPCQVERNCSVP